MSEFSAVRAYRVATLLIMVAGALPQPVPAQRANRQLSAAGVAADDATRIRRIETLADVWGKLELFHPGVALRGRFWWDSVLIAAIPRAENARSDEDFALVLNEELFERIGDPLSFARTQRQASRFDASDIPTDSIARVIAPGLAHGRAADLKRVSPLERVATFVDRVHY